MHFSQKYGTALMPHLLELKPLFVNQQIFPPMFGWGSQESIQENQQGYAKRHGYEWECDYFDYARFNDLAVQALVDIREKLLGVDVLMCIGADVMFTNWAIKIEDILKDGDSVVVAREKGGWWPINNDVMIYVNNEKTIAYMDRMIADFDIWKQHIWRQQQHLWNLIIEDEVIRNTVRIVDSQVMNQSMKMHL